MFIAPRTDADAHNAVCVRGSHSFCCNSLPVFFWAPTFKWGISLANIADINRPVENISVPQQAGTFPNLADGITRCSFPRLSVAVQRSVCSYALHTARRVFVLLIWKFHTRCCSRRSDHCHGIDMVEVQLGYRAGASDYCCFTQRVTTNKMCIVLAMEFLHVLRHEDASCSN